MIAQNLNMKLEGDLWIAFQLFAKRATSNGVSERTPEIVRQLIKETPEYAKIKGIPAVQEEITPIENPTPKENDTDSEG